MRSVNIDRRHRCRRAHWRRFPTTAQACAHTLGLSRPALDCDMARVKTFDWNDLRYLLAAARAGTLAGAARELGVEHSTVGRRLSALEQALGGSLVLRQPDGLVLTPLGQRVASAAGQVDQAMAGVLAAASEAHARVRLAVPSGFSELFTARLARLLDANAPIVLELVSSAATVDLVKGDADLAVRGGPITDPDLVARRLAAVGWSLYAAHAYLQRHPAPADPANLRGHQLIGYDAALADTPAARWIDAHATGAHIVMRSREMVDMASAAASGAGVAVLPCFLAATLPALLRMTPEVLATRELWLVYRREMRLSPAVQAAIRFVVEVIEDAAPALAGHSARTND
jgi:DNA-binding transcriptional LysR family regulator